MCKSYKLVLSLCFIPLIFSDDQQDLNAKCSKVKIEINNCKSNTGPTGASGRDGANGKDGIDGVNGLDGRDGVDGINGIDGKD